MMIKPTVLFLVISILGVSAYAQKSSVFIKGGLNIANISTTKNGNVDDANALASFHVGVMADLPLGSFVAIQPSLLFTGKGSKTQSGNPGDNSYYKATFNPHYVELPINLVFKIPLADKQNSFFVGAGPYLAVGVGGKNKAEGNFSGLAFKSSDKIDFSDDDPGTTNEQEGKGFGIMRRFDYGLNATAGFQLNTFLLSLNYGYGLAKINSDESNNNDKNKFRILSLTIGFKL